jgi:hypothetical protein
MSEPPPPPDPSSRPPRKVTLDVVLRREPRAPHPAHSAAHFTPQRWWVLGCFVVFCGASSYAWFELRGHPIAGYLSALPQVGALLGAGVTLLAGGDPTASRTWFQARASAALEWIDRRYLVVCALLCALSIALGYAGHAMTSIEVECPPGAHLAYGHLGASIACDQHDDRVWMPFGLDEVAATFECSLPGGHGDWEPLRRIVRDDEGSREVFTCYEDGARVVSHPRDESFLYLEYGWRESSPERSPAPCDHLPVGLYDYAPAENTCTWIGGIDLLTEAVRAALDEHGDALTRDALTRLLGSACHDCPPEAPEASEDAAAPSEPEPLQDAPTHAGRLRSATGCARTPSPPLAFFQPDACHHTFGAVSLELSARQVELPVAISYRGSDRRCVPSEYRRDGFVHLLLPDGELVLGITRATPHRAILLEDVRATTPPPALAQSCHE